MLGDFRTVVPGEMGASLTAPRQARRPDSTSSTSRSEPDEAVRGLEGHRDDAGGAVGGNPLDLDVFERLLDRSAEPLGHPRRVTSNLQSLERDVARGTRRRVQVGVALPLDEEGELRVRLQTLDAELLPEELGAVG